MTDKIFNFLINYFSNMNDRGVDKMNNFRGNITSNEVVEWLKKVQNIPVEQPNENFEEAFDEVLPYPNRHISEDAYNIKQMKEMFCAGAKWQKNRDEQIFSTLYDDCSLLKDSLDKVTTGNLSHRIGNIKFGITGMQVFIKQVIG